MRTRRAIIAHTTATSSASAATTRRCCMLRDTYATTARAQRALLLDREDAIAMAEHGLPGVVKSYWKESLL